MSLKLAKKDCRSNVYYSTRVLDQLTMQLNLFMGQSGLSLCVPTEELLHTKDDLLVRGGGQSLYPCNKYITETFF